MRGSTACIHSTCCQKTVSFIEGGPSRECPSREGPLNIAYIFHMYHCDTCIMCIIGQDHVECPDIGECRPGTGETQPLYPMSLLSAKLHSACDIS